jgi:hypothetical protein
MVTTKANNDITRNTVTKIANQSFDETYQVSVVEPVVFNPTTGTLDRMTQPFGDKSVYATSDIDEASATVTYIGKMNADGAWMVQKIDTTSGTAFTYATELNNATVTSYSDAWTGRAGLTYQAYSSAL